MCVCVREREREREEESENIQVRLAKKVFPRSGHTVLPSNKKGKVMRSHNTKNHSNYIFNVNFILFLKFGVISIAKKYLTPTSFPSQERSISHVNIADQKRKVITVFKATLNQTHWCVCVCVDNHRTLPI